MRYTTVFCFIVLSLVLIPAPAEGIAIGVNRASLHFEDVLRNGYARTEVVITTDSTQPVTGEIMLDESEAAEWLNFSDDVFTFSRDRPYTLYVDVQPPQDARVQTYRVNMSILTGELTRSEGGRMGTTTRASIGVPIFVRMSGTERAACRVAGVVVQDTEGGQPIEVRLSIINAGNVRVNPDIQIKVFDKFRAEELYSGSGSFGESVLPTVTQEGAVFYDSQLQNEQYWASVNVPLCGYSTLQTFDVLAPGAVKDDGELIRIDAPSWVETGDIVPIKAVFRNRGVRTVRANFRGTITRQETQEIVKVINTQQYLVDSDVTAEIETFFNPTEPGQYDITGKVFYNDKLTTERGAILNVNGASLAGDLGGTTIILFLLLAIIIVLFMLIFRKKRQKRLRSFRPR